MNYDQLYAMSKFASAEDRKRAINDQIDRLAKKRDHAADVEGKPMVAWSYQVDIDKLVALLDGQLTQPSKRPNGRGEAPGTARADLNR